MTFRELLEKYKNQTATPEERKQVETELEKYNALTEYLLEQDVDMEGEDLAGQQEELQKNRPLHEKTGTAHHCHCRGHCLRGHGGADGLPACHQ